MYTNKVFANNALTGLQNFAEKDGFLIAFSVFAVLLAGYFVYVVYSVTTNGKLVDIKALDEPLKDRIKRAFKGRKAAK
ncbi:MAG: hypothetical protein II867_01205 [Clostridia bacterium]|nr:hypothetical protein [Clostridia bacterium]